MYQRQHGDQSFMQTPFVSKLGRSRQKGLLEQKKTKGASKMTPEEDFDIIDLLEKADKKTLTEREHRHLLREQKRRSEAQQMTPAQPQKRARRTSFMSKLQQHSPTQGVSDYDYKKNEEAYRSVKRIQKLMQGSSKKATATNNGKDVLTQDDWTKPTKFGLQDPMVDSDQKSLSSATTANTMATFVKRRSTRSQQKRDDDTVSQISDVSGVSTRLIGRKRQQQESSPAEECDDIFDDIETCSQVSFGKPSTVKRPRVKAQPKLTEKIMLKNLKTGARKSFPLYREEYLKFLHYKKKGQQVLDFDLDNLELEYDYDTDEEQIFRAKKVMKHEAYQAVEFTVKEDILVVVENLVPQETPSPTE